jgi:hypothetical protein
MNNARQTGAVLEAHFQFLQWLFPAIARFPRGQKLLLTDRIQSIALDILESLMEATYTLTQFPFFSFCVAAFGLAFSPEQLPPAPLSGTKA